MKLPSFDIVGSREKAVAIIEMPEDRETAKKIAEEIMRIHKNVKTVLGKVGERKGEFRIRDYEVIMGEEDTEVVHKEYGCFFKLDPRKVYFSPREATERQRIASLVKPGEKVLVMFSGVAPIPIIIAKKQPQVEKIYAIELNPQAHRYAVENVRMNKVGHKVVLICGDVRDVCPKLKEKFDRVIMPLPKSSNLFLDVAIPCLKDGGMLHFYYWGKEGGLFSEAERILKEAGRTFGREVKIVRERKVLPYAPRKWKIVLDAIFEKAKNLKN